MKKLLTLLLILISSITYSQTGVGYLNYTVYNIISNGAGQYANNATDFVNMFDITKGAKVYATGTSTAAKTLYFVNGWQPSGVPNGGAYTGIKVTGYFVPKETGTYSFGIDGDDGVDFSIDGTVVVSFYGPHGFAGYRYGTINLVAGKTYTFMARYQNWGGGWGMDLAWKRPSQSSWTVQSNEVTSLAPAVPTKKALANFYLNTSIDATKFSIGSTTLSSVGSIDITTSLDSNKVNTGYKGTTLPGQVEWCAIGRSFSNGKTRILIDMRQIGNITPNTISNLKLLDIYDGPITYVSNDATWGQYDVPADLATLIPTSTFVNNFRGYSGYYGVSIDFTFTPTTAYKPQSIKLTTTNNITTLYNSIVTVSDVYLAFKELSNIGIFGNQSGNEFTYGIQYKNADVNDDGVFNETDCFILLQQLTGAKNIVDSFTLSKTLRMTSIDTYNTIGKSNWSTITTPLNDTYSFDINTSKPTDTFDISVAWKGDVNLSHSTTPKSNGITTMSVRTMNLSANNVINASIMTEMVGDSVYAYIDVDPLQQELVGTQFKLNYDNTLLKFKNVSYKTTGSPTNYGTDKGDYVNFGSLLTNGGILDKTTQYKITFTPQTKITNVLGLISVHLTDAVNKQGLSLKVNMN